MINQNKTLPTQYKSFFQGAYPWLVWFLGASFFFYKYVLQVSPSVMSADLLSVFSISGAGLGILAASFFYTYLIMQIPVGIMLDKWEPKIIILLAISACILGALLFSKTDSFYVAFFGRAVIGLGAAFAAVSCFKLATIWFPPERFAFIAGLSMTAAMLGAIGGEAPLSYLVQTFGWRTAMNQVALFGLILMIFIILFLRKSKDNSAISHSRNTNTFSLADQIKIIIKHKQTWLLSLYSGLAFAPVSVFGGLWGVSFLEQSYHLSATQASSSISVIFIGFAIGCPLFGWMSDFIGRRKIIINCGTAVSLLSILMILYSPAKSLALLQIFSFLFGSSASCFFLCFSMIREIHPIFFAATVLGFMNTFDSICEALTEPFIGKILDLGWDGQLSHGARIFSAQDYNVALSILPIYFMVSLIVLLFIRETHCRQIDNLNHKITEQAEENNLPHIQQQGVLN
jgi:MFS family permease